MNNKNQGTAGRQRLAKLPYENVLRKMDGEPPALHQETGGTHRFISRFRIARFSLRETRFRSNLAI
jgi:hypothetical protein